MKRPDHRYGTLNHWLQWLEAHPEELIEANDLRKILKALVNELRQDIDSVRRSADSAASAALYVANLSR